MEKEDFKRLELLGAEAIRLKSKLERLRNASTVPATNYSPAGGRNGTGDAVSRAVCKEDEMLNEIDTVKKEMHDIISTEKDEQMQELLRLRFVEMLSWSKVAERLGYDSGSPVFKRYKRYKRKMEMDMETEHGVK